MGRPGDVAGADFGGMLLELEAGFRRGTGIFRRPGLLFPNDACPTSGRYAVEVDQIP